MSMHPLRAYVVVKKATPGKTKTRLHPVLSPQAASDLACCFLHDVVLALQTRGDLEVHLAVDELGEEHLKLCSRDRVNVLPEPNLGTRLSKLCAEHFRKTQDRPLLILGGDSPGLPPALIDEAVRGIAQGQDVIGPCRDGGFYLLGLTRGVGDVFNAVAWSSPRACQDMVAQIHRQGRSVHVLGEWFDVDEPQDLEGLWRGLLRGELVAAQTYRYLQRRLKKS